MLRRCVVLLLLAVLLCGCSPAEPDDTTVPRREPGVVDLDRIIGFTAENKDELDLGGGLYITAVGRYTGGFVEDGSDTPITDVLAVCVENRSKEAVQYAVITLSAGDAVYTFQLTTLPAKTTALVMEKSAALWQDTDYSGATLTGCSFFADKLSIQPERFAIYVKDGMISLENLGQDVAGDICVYYKGIVSGVYLGGITYRARATGGLAAGEICQISSGHYTVDGSQILFVTGGG